MVPWSASNPIQAYTRNRNDVQNGKIIANNNNCLVTGFDLTIAYAIGQPISNAKNVDIRAIFTEFK